MNSFHVIFAEKKYKNETKDEKEFLNTEKNCYVSYLVEEKISRKEHTRYGPPCTHFLFFLFLHFFWQKKNVWIFFLEAGTERKCLRLIFQAIIIGFNLEFGKKDINYSISFTRYHKSLIISINLLGWKIGNYLLI
jgi:hypothetical protein